MADMITINDKWTIDLDDFDHTNFFVGEETVTTVIDGEEKQHTRYIYDNDSYYKAIRLKEDKDRSEHKDKIIAAFTERGIVTAEIAFSGGNDSGSCDEHTFYDADGNKIDGISTGYISTNHNVDGKWVERELTDDDKAQNAFISLVDAPIYWRWGSFAGDFSVYGTMYYDISPDTDRQEHPTEEGMLARGEYCRLEFQESSYEYGESSF